MPFVAALSQHPLAAEAVGEVLGTVVEANGVGPDLVAVFASGDHAEFLGEISAAIRQVLAPGTLVGASSGAVLAGSEEAEDPPALSVFAAWGTNRAPLGARALRLETGPVHDDGDGPAVMVEGVPTDVASDATVLLLADPFSFPTEGFLAQLAQARPDVQVVGGLASAAASPRGNTLVLDGELYRDGAVGVALPPGSGVQATVSQGCRPVGEPMVVTRSEGNYVLELAGRPALARLTELASSADADERVLLAKGVQLGIVIDETRPEFRRGDFLVRSVIGADRDKGVLAVGTSVPVGTTVQFHVRDARSADEDLRAALDELEPPRSGAAGALLFTCNGRGRALFGAGGHDATMVSEALGSSAVAGMFCAGEVGPVATRSFVHGFTASLLVFG